MATIPELRINGSSTIYQDYGVRMGDGFLDALTEPLDLKEFIENESRLEHGKRVVIDDEPKVKSRDLTLDFTIKGKDPADFLKKKNAFLALVYKGEITLQVPENSDDVYHLIYKGKGAEYSLNYNRTFCHMVLKFEEPNPMRRTSL